MVIDQQYFDELITCYGWDGNEWEGAPPPISSCDPNALEDCEIQLEWDSSIDASTGDCETGCAVGASGDDPPDECCIDADEEALMMAVMDAQWNDIEAVEDIIADPVGGCPGVVVDYRIDCTIGEALAQLTYDCPTSSVALTEGADYIAEVDEADSYLTVYTSAGQDTVPLTGMGTVEASTTEFLSAIVDTTETLDIGSDDYIEWRLFFGADIDFNFSSGAFVVPHSPGYTIRGRGKKNTDWGNASFGATANASGQFNNGTGKWYLDYYSTFTGGWVEVHLEGDFYGTSP